MSQPQFQLSLQKKADGVWKPFGAYGTLSEATGIADALVKARAAHAAQITQVVYTVSSRPGAHPGDVPLPLGTDAATPPAETSTEAPA